MRAGIAARFARGWIALDGDVQPAWKSTPWGVDRVLVWNARLGGMWRVGKHLAIGAGLFTDRSPDPAPTAFPQSSIDFYGATAGIKLDDVHLLAASEKSHSLTFSTTLAGRYSYGTGQIAGLFVNFNPGPMQGGIGSHTSDVTVHELAVQLDSAVSY